MDGKIDYQVLVITCWACIEAHKPWRYRAAEQEHYYLKISGIQHH